MRQESRRLFGLRPLRSRGLWKGKVLKNVKVSTVPSAPWCDSLRFGATAGIGRGGWRLGSEGAIYRLSV